MRHPAIPIAFACANTAVFPTAHALHDALDPFLQRWAVVSPATLPAFADRTAAWLGLDAPPRLAHAVFPRLGIDVDRVGLPAGAWAVWTLEGDRYRIRISPFLSAPRANFTLWHEWFEIMASRPAFPRLAPPASRPAVPRQAPMAARAAFPCLAPGGTAPGRQTAGGTTAVRPPYLTMEAMADRFAACLTMPAPAVRRLVQELSASGDKTDVMAARLGVSVSALRRRLRELGMSREPCVSRDVLH